MYSLYRWKGATKRSFDPLFRKHPRSPVRAVGWGIVRPSVYDDNLASVHHMGCEQHRTIRASSWGAAGMSTAETWSLTAMAWFQDHHLHSSWYFEIRWSLSEKVIDSHTKKLHRVTVWTTLIITVLIPIRPGQRQVCPVGAKQARSEIWQASRQHCCRCGCQISKRCDNSNCQSFGFETGQILRSRNFGVPWTCVSNIIFTRLWFGAS